MVDHNPPNPQDALALDAATIWGVPGGWVHIVEGAAGTLGGGTKSNAAAIWTDLAPLAVVTERPTTRSFASGLGIYSRDRVRKR